MLVSDVKRYLYISSTHNHYPIFKFIPWGIIKAVQIITSSTISAKIKTWLTLILATVTFVSVFPWTVVDSSEAVQSLTLLNAPHFPFTTSGLMIDCVAPVPIVEVCCLPFIYPHGVRLLLFCWYWYWDCGALDCGSQHFPSVLLRFSLTQTLVNIVSSSPVSCYLMVMRSWSFPWSLKGTLEVTTQSWSI